MVSFSSCHMHLIFVIFGEGERARTSYLDVQHFAGHSIDMITLCCTEDSGQGQQALVLTLVRHQGQQ